jgi:N-acetylmuramoyl-L-alanine amidase
VQPAKGQKPAAKKTVAAEPAQKTVIYRVKKGDTLEKIADRNGTTVAELLKLNNMKLKDPLYVDRKLKVPVPAVKEEEKAAPEVITYQVKKGDTLEKIALMHHTTVRSIRTLNNLKPNDPMVAGRKLKVAVEKPDEDLPVEPVQPAKGQTPAAKKTVAAEPSQKTVIYRVKKGDTLEKIADRNGTTVAELLKLNNMKLKEPLYVDRKLKVPVAEKEKGRDAAAEKKPAVKPKKNMTYVVKKGDTLEKIALKHNTTIAALMKVNKIKLNEPLYVNRKLIIPAEADI